ncbi:MAG: SDR family NAD(P)-dependent oxidoreductase [Gemmatimonadota bacterium]
MDRPLTDRFALVTGASRGVGRGIAHELGLVGATVYVTGRSRLGRTTDGLPGTVEETARLVTEAGGRGIAVVCDHTKDTDVRALADKIQEEAGRLDLLVNNVWGGYEQYDARLFELPVWDQPLWRWDKMFATGVRAHYTTSRATLPLLLRSDRPLLINISAGDRGRFLGDVQYDVAKAAVDRLSFALARRHREEGLVTYTLHPGFTRTERVEAEYEGEEVPEGARERMQADSQSPRFVGRAVVALATASHLEKESGAAYRVDELGLELEFTDVNGSRPEPFELPTDL